MSLQKTSIWSEDTTRRIKLETSKEMVKEGTRVLWEVIGGREEGEQSHLLLHLQFRLLLDQPHLKLLFRQSCPSDHECLFLLCSHQQSKGPLGPMQESHRAEDV